MILVCQIVSPLSNEPVPPDVLVAVAIRETLPGRHHATFIYRANDGTLNQLHLAWHMLLRDEPFPEGDGYFWGRLGLDPINQRVLSAFLPTVDAIAGSVPYGIDWESTQECFNPDGSLILLPLGKGLTCATFLAAILKSQGYQLVDIATWPVRPDDIVWQEEIITLLSQREANLEHVEEMRRDVGGKRLKPAEAVGACFQLDWPVGFDEASQVAGQILRDMSSADSHGP